MPLVRTTSPKVQSIQEAQVSVLQNKRYVGTNEQ